MNTCIATCTSGRPCTARARPARPYCFAHDPALQPRRAAALPAGGTVKLRRLAAQFFSGGMHGLR